jgi:hypothetical protein
LKNITAISNNLVGLEISTSDEARDNNARMIDSRVVGYNEILYEDTRDHEHNEGKHFGIVTSRSEGMHIENVHFYNFNHGNEKYYCIQTCSKCASCKRGGKTVSVKGLQFTNVTSYV